jgi:hypothetical protein
MDQIEWRKCKNPVAMLDALREKTTARKLRLFACACCRRVSGRLLDVRSRHALEIAELHADGLIDDKGLEAAKDAS